LKVDKNENGQENARQNNGCTWRRHNRSEVKRGSWRSKYKNFKVKEYFSLYNTILKVF